MKQLFIYFCVVAFSVILEASSGSAAQLSLHRNEVPSRIKVVFYDFYETQVRLSINGKVVLDETLNVTEPSTGFSLENTFAVKQDNVFYLTFGDVAVKVPVVLNSKSKLILISPHKKPFVEVSEIDALLLD